MQIEPKILEEFILEHTDLNELDAHVLANKICNNFSLNRKSDYKLNADDVRALRKKTGDSLQVCKMALIRTEGDMDEAYKVVREYGNMAAFK